MNNGTALVFYDKTGIGFHVESEKKSRFYLSGHSQYRRDIRNRRNILLSKWQKIQLEVTGAWMGITPMSQHHNMRFKVGFAKGYSSDRSYTLFGGSLLMHYLTRKVSRQIDAISDTRS